MTAKYYDQIATLCWEISNNVTYYTNPNLITTL